jgi:hypothetical protein
VAARLRVYDSGICFVCSHLSSGENEGDELKRNYDYSEIVRRGQFPPDSVVLDPETSLSASPGADSTSQVTNPQPLGPTRDHVYTARQGQLRPDSCEHPGAISGPPLLVLTIPYR